MKRATFILIGFLVVVMVAVYFWSQSLKTTLNLTPSPSSKVNKEITYNCEKEKTAFDILIEKYPDTKFDESTFGKLVTSIDGKTQGNNKYWLYSIDNKEATVGASSYICQGKENIKWELK